MAILDERLAIPAGRWVILVETLSMGEHNPSMGNYARRCSTLVMKGGCCCRMLGILERKMEIEVQRGTIPLLPEKRRANIQALPVCAYIELL